MTYLTTTFAQVCNVVLFHRRFRKTSGLHHDMVLGCQNPSPLWQSTADVRASVSIERFKLFPLASTQTHWPGLPASTLLKMDFPCELADFFFPQALGAGFSGRKATLIDYRFGKMYAMQ